jgi:ribose/xylose/arabinose/galactoside ABC-type transport system permease subunit
MSNANEVSKRLEDAARKETLQSAVRNYALLAVLLLMCVIMSIVSPTFLTFRNIINIFRQISINGILAVGMTLVIILGGIDISIGSLAAVAGVVAAMVMEQHPNLAPVAIVLGIASCAVLGAVTGFLVSKFKIAPFIATLAMMTVARGLALVIADGIPHTIRNPFYVSLGNGYVWNTATIDTLNLPIPVLLLAVVVFVIAVMLYKTRFGRYIFAVGGNENAARVSGVSVDAIKFWTFVINGVLCGIAGVVLSARITSGQPAAASGYELDAIAAAVIGGASLAGGAGKISGTIIGALIIGVLNNGLVLLGASSYSQQIIKGVIIAGAVILDQRTKIKR